MTGGASEWPGRLETLLSRCEHLAHAIVLEETGSTQDAAKRLGALPGDVVIAARQTAGRGRMGRAWADTGDDGLAVSIVVSRGAPERLALMAAVAVADALASLCTNAAGIGIKWPNDVVARDRKLAGILIEQVDHRAIIGVGVNVAQESWPADLRGRAISLRELGSGVDRLPALLAVLESFDRAMSLTDDELAAKYAARCSMRGEVVTLYHKGAPITGRVMRVDPMRGLLVQTDQGERWLPAATTSTQPSA